MLNEKSLINEIVNNILEVQSHSKVSEMFTLNQLNQAIEYYTSKRQILISEKEDNINGYDIERINNELSGLRVEITKINKAISLLLSKKKNKSNLAEKPKLTNLKDSLDELNEDQKKIIAIINDTRTVQEIYEQFDLDQLVFAKNHFKEVRKKTIVDMEIKAKPTITQQQYNELLRNINTKVSKITKAIQHLERLESKKNNPEKESNLEASYSFLLAFHMKAKALLTEDQYKNIKDEIFKNLES